MLAMLGAMGVLLAGIALPALFDDDDDSDDDRLPEDAAPATEMAEGEAISLDDPEAPAPAEFEPDVESRYDPGDVEFFDESLAASWDDAEALAEEAASEFGAIEQTVTDTLIDSLPPDPTEGDPADETVLEGTPGADDLVAGPGDDGLDGGGGDDTLDGGPGDDTVKGGADDDSLIGGSGDDVLVDGEGEDTLEGGPGDDTLHGTATGGPDAGPDGRDHLHGGPGDDSIDVGAMDFVTGGDGSDTFTLSAAIGIGEQAEIVDFDAAHDKLVVLWDDSDGGPEPEIGLGRIEDSETMVQVLLDGVVVAHVSGGSDLSIDDIALVAASDI